MWFPPSPYLRNVKIDPESLLAEDPSIIDRNVRNIQEHFASVIVVTISHHELAA
jgi:hypothetical protein